MRKRKRLYLAALATAFALVAAACGGDGDGPTAGGDGQDCVWTIATMGALSGDFASLGQPIADGVRFAVDDANENRDLACEIAYTEEDSQGDPNQAPALAEKIIGEETVVFCTCPYFSGETLAAGPLFSDAGLPFGGTGTNETIDEQGFETWFRAVAPDNIQAEVAAQYIADGLGAQSVGVVHDNQDYSKGLADGVARELGDVVNVRGVINPEETDYSAVVTKVVDANPDVVFFGGYTPQAGPLAKQLQEAGYGGTFMSDDGSKDPTFGGLAGPASEGLNSLVSCPCVDPLKVDAASSFVDGMRAEFGKNAPGTFAADLYDLTNVAFDALEEYDGDVEDIEAIRAHIVEFLDNAEGVEGVAKSYSWNDDGEFEGGPEDIWIYEWSNKAENFVSLGAAADLLNQ